MLYKNNKLTRWKKRFSVMGNAIMVFCSLLASGGEIRCAEMPFGNQALIAESERGLNSLHTADLNGDGRMDILPASIIIDNVIFWYENLGDDTFKRCIIRDEALSTTGDDLYVWFAPAADLDRDGDLDILAVLHRVISESQPDVQDAVYDDEYHIVWYPNDGQGNFGAHREISPGPDEPLSISAADIDHDGDVDIIAVLHRSSVVPAEAVEYEATNEEYYIVWYPNDANGNYGDPLRISEFFLWPVTASPADLDGDGDLDVLSASQGDNLIVWYKNQGADGFSLISNETWSTGGARLALATDLDGDGDLDMVSAPSDDRMTWFENDGTGNFNRPQIVNGEEYYDIFSSVYPIDFDQDGDKDLLTASEYAGSASWYENSEQDGERYFQKHPIGQLPTSVSAAAPSTGALATAADIDADGDWDVIAAFLVDAEYAAYSLAYYKNESLHQSPDFELTSEIASDAAVTSNIPADIDQDGDQDLVVATESGEIAFYENIDGKIETIKQPISKPISGDEKPVLVRVIDYDRDGDVDIVACDRTGIRMYERESSAFVIPEKDLVTFPADREILQFEAADLDKDAKPELVLAFSQSSTSSTEAMKVVCYTESESILETAGITTESSPRVETASNLTEVSLVEGVQVPEGAVKIHLADIYQNGRQDLILSYKIPEQDRSRIVLYKNPGEIEDWLVDPDEPTVPVVVSEEAACEEVYTADMDRDGDLDIVTATKDPDGIVKTVWLENEKVAVAVEATALDAADIRSFTTENVICENDEAPTSIRVADLDRDGDADVLTTASDSLSLYENADGKGMDFTDEEVILDDTSCKLADPVDLDKDGNLDILYYRDTDEPGIGLCQNGSGQFSLDTSVTAPASIAPGEMDDVFKIDFTHRGRLQENPIELASLELLFEKEEGVPLTESETNRLVDDVVIYLDDGSGTFEPEKDTLIVTELYFQEGSQTVAFQDGDPIVQVVSGSPKSYFVVVKLTEDAGQQEVKQFRLAHLTESSSTAEDSIRDVRLTMQRRRDTRSEFISVEEEPVDSDGDGFTSDEDCDDTNPAINPGATEICDGLDNNCNGEIDEGVTTTFYQDADSDGYGNPSLIREACSTPDGYVENNSDCNDDDAEINPHAIEICDEIDNDCDTEIDENVQSTFFRDSDSDGFGNPGDFISACSVPTGYVTDNNDCDDTTESVNPSATEVCDGVDNNCNSETDEGVTTTFYQDADSDGYGNPSLIREACSTPDGYVENNSDCNDDDAEINPETVWYKDIDGDKHSDGTKQPQCEQPAGYFLAKTLLSTTDDCNDDDAGINPDAIEICDEIDNDCDTEIDENVQSTFFRDSDSDGFGNPGDSISACSAPTGYVADNNDCDDTKESVNPTATEICNGADDNCDGGVDEGNICGFTLCSSLRNSRFARTDVDIFRFTGKRGEQVVLSLTSQPEGAVGAVSLSVFGPGTYKRDLSLLPNRISFTLPRTGNYFVMISNLVRNRYSGNYCLTLESKPVGNTSLARLWSVEN